MILIVTNASDVTADFLTKELDRRNIEYARLNTDEFPQHLSGTVRLGIEDRDSSILKWLKSGKVVEFGDIRSVWYRRPIAPIPSSQIEHPGTRKFASDEAYEFLRGLWFGLECKWMSHPNAIRRAEHKLVQLHVAKELGFNIPKTVVTNEPTEIRRLWGMCPRGIVVKPLYLGFIDDSTEPKFIYTTQVESKDLEHIDSAKLAPSIYQERIEKAADIRVTVVGERAFSAKIVAPDLPLNMPDWRYAPHETLQQEPYRLPAMVERLCIHLVRRLGLLFGAIDLGLQPDGTYSFFEINPNGQWAWLETDAGLKISSAIADELIKI